MPKYEVCSLFNIAFKMFNIYVIILLQNINDFGRLMIKLNTAMKFNGCIHDELIYMRGLSLKK